MKSSPGTFPAKRSTPCRCFKSTSMKPLLRKISRTQVLRHPHTGTRTRTRTKVNFDPVAWDVCLGNALRSIPPNLQVQYPPFNTPVQYPIEQKAAAYPRWTGGFDTYLHVCSYMCSPMCFHICPPLCNHMRALSYVLSYVCSSMCSHMCALIYVLSYVCSPLCPHMCALICVRAFI